MSNLKTNFIYNSLLTITGFVTPLITFPYATRVLGPEGIGLSNFVSSVIQYFIMIAALGIPIYGIRIVAQNKSNKNDLSKVFSELITIRFAITLLIAVLYTIVIFTFKQFNQNLLFFLFGIIILIINVFDINWFFTGIENFKFITIRSVVLQITQIILLFILIKTRKDVLLYFLLPFITSFLTILINIKYAQKFVRIRLIIKDILSLKKHIIPLITIFSSLAAISLYTVFDTVILGFLTNDYHVGIYTASMRINKVPIAFITALVPIMIPRISSSVANKNIEEISNLTQKTIMFVVTVAFPIMCFLYFLAPEIVYILSGQEFKEAIITTKVLCPITLIIGLTNNFSMQLLLPFGKEKQLFYAVLCGSIISIGCNLLFIPRMYENGAAFTNVLAELAVLIACFLFANKTIKIKLPFKSIISNFFVSLLFFPISLIIRYFFTSNAIIILASLFVFAIFYFIIQYHFLKNKIILDSAAYLGAKIQISKYKIFSNNHL